MLLALREAPKKSAAAYIAEKTALFRPKVEFKLDLKNFVIETVSTAAELHEVLELRRHSFVEEFAGIAGSDYMDFDDYDMAADHIVVRSKKTGQIVSSYRAINSSFTNRLFSEEQFDLKEFMKDPGIKTELSRAVVHKDHRNGLTLSLVWKGIAHYAKISNARYLCGCASTKTTSQRIAESIYWHLYPSLYQNRFHVHVLPAFVHPTEFDPAELTTWEFAKEAIPPLLKAYIKAGAKICSRPAYDRVFQCVDFFTVLDLQEMDGQYQERYFG